MSLADGGDGVRAGIADGRYGNRDNPVTPGPPPEPPGSCSVAESGPTRTPGGKGALPMQRCRRLPADNDARTDARIGRSDRAARGSDPPTSNRGLVRDGDASAFHECGSPGRRVRGRRRCCSRRKAAATASADDTDRVTVVGQTGPPGTPPGGSRSTPAARSCASQRIGHGPVSSLPRSPGYTSCQHPPANQPRRASEHSDVHEPAFNADDLLSRKHRPPSRSRRPRGPTRTARRPPAPRTPHQPTSGGFAVTNPRLLHDPGLNPPDDTIITRHPLANSIVRAEAVEARKRSPDG